MTLGTFQKLFNILKIRMSPFSAIFLAEEIHIQITVFNDSDTKVSKLKI